MDLIVSRYASAIASIAKDENKCEQYKKAFASLLDTFNGNEQLVKFLESYFIKDEEKYKIIDELTASFKSDNLTNFLKLLTKKHLINKYKDIVKEINKLLNEQLQIEEGFVYSTSLLSEEQKTRIEEAISKKLNQKVELKNVIDERLIGGVRVVIHDHVYDGSIKYKLENLQNNLKERRDDK